MLKSLSLVTLGVLISTGALAGVEFRAKYTRTECSIANNEVTRTVSFGKEKDVKLTEVSKVSFQGVEAAARKAAATSTGIPSADEATYDVMIDGEKYSLNAKDSEESLAIIQLIVKACQLYR